MTSRLLISLSVLLIAAQKLCAQLAPAEDFFNGGAQLYISNNIPSALERVELGLKSYPDDEKLKKLEQLLKQQQQQQQNQQNQQQQHDQKNQQQKNQQEKSDEQEKQDQKQQDQQKQDEQKQNQSDRKKDEQQKQQEQKKDSGDKSKDQKQEQQQGRPVKPGEMTPEEAKRLLDAQKDNEQLLQMKPQEKPRDSNRPVKDW
jgi:Ca-activated chloride channel family protein